MKLEGYVYQVSSFEVASDIFRDMKRKYLLIVIFVSCSGTELSVLTPAPMKYYIHRIINAIVFIILQFYALVIDVTIGGEMDCLYHLLFYFLFLIFISLFYIVL
jgi:hypothetical protein